MCFSVIARGRVHIYGEIVKMNKSIKLTENRILGRYAVIDRNISAGEILFEEYPFVVGPKNNSKIVCLVCCRPLSGSGISEQKCPKCRWPLCENCISEPVHKLECEIFVKSSVKFHNLNGTENGDVCLQLDCIFPLRFLLLIELNPDRWETEISLMEHHESARRNSLQWNVDENNIVGYLHGPCKLKNRFPADMIQRICGIIEVNSFEARNNGHELRCIFPKTAVMSHSCIPNTCHSILGSDGYKIIVRALVDIEKDEPLTACYTYTMSGTLFRQDHLKKGKYFTCECARCTDPTELGTNFSSIKCEKCDDGYIVSSDPLDENSPWKCIGCTNTISSSVTCQTFAALQSEANSVEPTLFTPEGIEKCEYLLKNFKHKLHPNHFIQIDLKQNLIKMLGRTAGYQLNELSDIQLKYKIDLCYHVLSVLNVLHPGQTRLRAMLLYEMHAPIFLHGKMAFRKGVINESQLKEIFTKSIDLLDECITILQREDVTSIENKVVYVAANTLKYLQEAIKELPQKNNFY